MTDHPTCDIFCRVIDNYGDIGVCWRLARQLQAEHGWRIRLWVDDLLLLEQIAAPVAEIELRHWQNTFPDVSPAHIVIEAFACELPDSYLAAMAAQQEKPVWINLEYLCVEAWGADFHGQPSPHPRLPLTKYFFVPGTPPGTGGLLCEADLLARHAAHQRMMSADALQVFLFCYENPALPHLLDAWTESHRPIHCHVAQGKPNAQVAAWLGQMFTAGTTQQRGALTLSALPFVEQKDFDVLLWNADLNFVRGEDSFARAQWAALPLIWQIYRQEEAAHHIKLDAFLGAYTEGLSVPARQALLDFSAVWNGQSSPGRDAVTLHWHTLANALPSLQLHAKIWQEHLISLSNLANNLAIFCKKF